MGSALLIGKEKNMDIVKKCACGLAVRYVTYFTPGQLFKL